jgi:hypothetical protein
MQSLFAFLKVPNNLLKHWSDCVGWEITEGLHCVVLIAIKKVIMASSFLYIFVDEMTIVDNQSWICIHCYVVVGWKRMPILLTLEHLVKGGATTDIKNVILATLILYSALINEQIYERLIC